MVLALGSLLLVMCMLCCAVGTRTRHGLGAYYRSSSSLGQAGLSWQIIEEEEVSVLPAVLYVC